MVIFVACSAFFALGVLNGINDSLEGFGIVKSEVGEDLTVDLDTCFVDEAHEL